VSSRKNHSAAEAKLAAGSSGARQAEVSEASGKGLPSGTAGPGSGAAAMWSHMAAAKLVAVKRPAEQAELSGRQAFEQASERERPERSVRTLAAAELERVSIACRIPFLGVMLKEVKKEGLDTLPL